MSPRKSLAISDSDVTDGTAAGRVLTPDNDEAGDVSIAAQAMFRRIRSDGGHTRQRR